MIIDRRIAPAAPGLRAMPSTRRGDGARLTDGAGRGGDAEDECRRDDTPADAGLRPAVAAGSCANAETDDRAP